MSPQDSERERAFRTARLHAHLSDHARDYGVRLGAARDLAARLTDLFTEGSAGTWSGPGGASLGEHLEWSGIRQNAQHLFVGSTGPGPGPGHEPDAGDPTGATPKPKPTLSPALAKLQPAERAALTPTQRLDLVHGAEPAKL